MVNFLYSTNMPQDFELYDEPEQSFGFVPSSQPFISSVFPTDADFNAPYGQMPMEPSSDHAQNVQFHYDAIAQGVKPLHYTPHDSPLSATHSFEQPPILCPESEASASVSSSTLGSPSLHPQYNEPWTSMTSRPSLSMMQNGTGFGYDCLVQAEKVPGCVGKFQEVSFVFHSFVSTSSVYGFNRDVISERCCETLLLFIICIMVRLESQ
jgi:hypothetical protein